MNRRFELVLDVSQPRMNARNIRAWWTSPAALKYSPAELREMLAEWVRCKFITKDDAETLAK